MASQSDKKHLSKRSVDGATRPGEGEARVWDDEIKGFCLRTYASGRKVYAIKYRVGRVQRWYTIGEHGAPWMDGETPTTLTAEIARREAQKVKGAALAGGDFQADKIKRRKDLTVSQLIDLYLEDGPVTRPAKRASSWAADKACLNHHIRPQIGSKIARLVTRGDITKALKGVREGATAKTIKTKPRGRAVVRGGEGIAGRVKAATSAMFGWAAERGLMTANPAARIKLAKRPAKERFLSQAEAAKLLEALSTMVATKSADEAHADAIRLLLLTGARKNEIVGLRWEEIDLERARIVLPPERTKAGGKTGERRIALNRAAAQILTDRKGDRSAPKGLLFPAARGKGQTTGVQKTWEAVRKVAKLDDVRLHDLRHSWASFAVADGASLFLVGKALGHADARTTQRYAHISDDPLDALAEATGRRISGETEGAGDGQ